MKMQFSSKGNFEKAIKWLKESNMKKPDKALRNKADEGLNALIRATPIGETGETSSGWEYKISKTSSGIELSYYNTAHPETEVNVAKLIQLGHGTKNGGYVPPNNFIHPAINGVFGANAGRLMKEMMD